MPGPRLCANAPFELLKSFSQPHAPDSPARFVSSLKLTVAPAPESKNWTRLSIGAGSPSCRTDTRTVAFGVANPPRTPRTSAPRRAVPLSSYRASRELTLCRSVATNGSTRGERYGLCILTLGNKGDSPGRVGDILLHLVDIFVVIRVRLVGFYHGGCWCDGPQCT